MVDDGTYLAVLDRFGGDEAVLILEADGDTVGQLVVDSEVSLSEGRQQDAIFTVVVRDDTLEGVTYEPERTDRRQESAQSRFDRLAERADREE